MLGLIGLIIANQSSLQWKITMQERHLCWLPYFVPWPRSVSHFCHSRIATVTPVSHPPTRLIHICPSCWIIYRSFEITLEMGTVHWIELQIQCSVQTHCFKKTFSPTWITWARENSGEWARVKRERTKSQERLLRTILFYSGHLQHERERPDMERKYMNSDKAQRKEPELAT